MNLALLLVVCLSLALNIANVADAQEANAVKPESGGNAGSVEPKQPGGDDILGMSLFPQRGWRSGQPGIFPLLFPALGMLLNWGSTFPAQQLLGAAMDTQTPQESGVVLVLAEDEKEASPTLMRSTRSDRLSANEADTLESASQTDGQNMPVLSKFFRPLAGLGQPGVDLGQMLGEYQQSLQQTPVGQMLSQTWENLQQQQQNFGQMLQSDLVQNPFQMLGQSFQQATADLAERFEQNGATLGQSLQQVNADLTQALQQVFPPDLLQNTGQMLGQAFPWAKNGGGLFGGAREQGIDGGAPTKREARSLCGEASQLSEVRVKPDGAPAIKDERAEELRWNKTPSEKMSEMKLHANLQEVSKQKNLPILWFHLPEELGKHRGVDRQQTPDLTQEDRETEAKLLAFESKVIQELQLLQEMERQAKELRAAAKKGNATEDTPYKLKYVLGKTPVHKITRADVEKTLRDDYFQKLLQKTMENVARNIRDMMSSSKTPSSPRKRQTDSTSAVNNFTKEDLLKMMVYAMRQARNAGRDSSMQPKQNTESRSNLRTHDTRQCTGNDKMINSVTWNPEKLPKHQSMEDQQRQMAVIQLQQQPLPQQWSANNHMMEEMQRQMIQVPDKFPAHGFHPHMQVPVMHSNSHSWVNMNNGEMMKSFERQQHEPMMQHTRQEMGTMNHFKNNMNSMMMMAPEHHNRMAQIQQQSHMFGFHPDQKSPEMHSRYWIDMKNLEIMRSPDPMMQLSIAMPPQQQMQMEHQMNSMDHLRNNMDQMVMPEQKPIVHKPPPVAGASQIETPVSQMRTIEQPTTCKSVEPQQREMEEQQIAARSKSVDTSATFPNLEHRYAVTLRPLMMPSAPQQQGNQQLERQMDELHHLRDRTDPMMLFHELTPSGPLLPFVSAAPQMKEHESQARFKGNLYGVLRDDPNQFQSISPPQSERTGVLYDLFKDLVKKPTTPTPPVINYHYYNSDGVRYPGTPGARFISGNSRGLYGNGAVGSNAYGTAGYRTEICDTEVHRMPGGPNMQMTLTQVENPRPNSTPANHHPNFRHQDDVIAATSSVRGSPTTSAGTNCHQQPPTSPTAEPPSAVDGDDHISTSPQTSPEDPNEVGISLFGFDPLILQPFMGLHPIERPNDPWLHKVYDPHRPLFTSSGSYEAYLKDGRFRRDTSPRTLNMMTPDVLDRLLRIKLEIQKNAPHLYQTIVNQIQRSKVDSRSSIESTRFVNRHMLELAAAEGVPSEDDDK